MGDGTGGPGASQKHPPNTTCEQQLGKKVLFSSSTAIPAESRWKGSRDLPSAGMDNTGVHFYAIFWAVWEDLGCLYCEQNKSGLSSDVSSGGFTSSVLEMCSGLQAKQRFLDIYKTTESFYFQLLSFDICCLL